MSGRVVLTVVLAVLALLTSYWAWKLRPQPPVEEVTGPLRGDYTVEDYRLVVMNKQGQVSFRSQGPYAARDPNSQQLFINQPKFSFPDKAAKADWTGHAESGWVNAAGDEIRLKRDVVLDGPILVGKDQTHIRTERMTIFPTPQTAHSDILVTITRGASILLGTGMNAWMKTSRIELLSKVSLHDVPEKKKK